MTGTETLNPTIARAHLQVQGDGRLFHDLSSGVFVPFSRLSIQRDFVFKAVL